MRQTHTFAEHRLLHEQMPENTSGGLPPAEIPHGNQLPEAALSKISAQFRSLDQQMLGNAMNRIGSPRNDGISHAEMFRAIRMSESRDPFEYIPYATNAFQRDLLEHAMAGISRERMAGIIRKMGQSMTSSAIALIGAFAPAMSANRLSQAENQYQAAEPMARTVKTGVLQLMMHVSDVLRSILVADPQTTLYGRIDSLVRESGQSALLENLTPEEMSDFELFNRQLSEYIVANRDTPAFREKRDRMLKANQQNAKDDAAFESVLNHAGLLAALDQRAKEFEWRAAFRELSSLPNAASRPRILNSDGQTLSEPAAAIRLATGSLVLRLSLENPDIRNRLETELFPRFGSKVRRRGDEVRLENLRPQEILATIKLLRIYRGRTA